MHGTEVLLTLAVSLAITAVLIAGVVNYKPRDNSVIQELAIECFTVNELSLHDGIAGRIELQAKPSEDGMSLSRENRYCKLLVQFDGSRIKVRT